MKEVCKLEAEQTVGRLEKPEGGTQRRTESSLAEDASCDVAMRDETQRQVEPPPEGKGGM